MGSTTSLTLGSNGHCALISMVLKFRDLNIFGLFREYRLSVQGWLYLTRRFKCMSSMPLHCMLLRVRHYLPLFLLIHILIHIIFYSTCSSVMSAVTSWLWLSSVRSSHVQQTWIWERKYDSCMPSYIIWLPYVRLSHLFDSLVAGPHTHFFFFFK